MAITHTRPVLPLASPSRSFRQGFRTEILSPYPVAVRRHTMKLTILLCSLLFAAIAAKDVVSRQPPPRALALTRVH